MEQKIVEMLSHGYTVKEIADYLVMNVRTVEARLTRIRDKVNAKNLHHLVAIYLRKKLIK